MTTLKKILVTIYFVVLVFFNIYSVNAQVSVSPNKDIVAGDQQVDKETGLAPYRPLAPIPGLPNEISSDVSNPNAFTLPSYIRILVRIAIGIIGILSVVMIIIGGVQYMSTDAFSGKEDGKERVTQALKGLVLAVVAVFVLRTINPQLITLQITDTEFNSGVSVNAEGITVPEELKGEFEREDLDPASPVPGSVSCKQGMITIETANQKGVIVCKDVAEKYKEMILAAKKDGVILTASGGRTMETQISLRKQNCGTSQYDIYEKPSNQCKPQTARPGRSMHQQGLAFDIGVNGKTICFSKNSTVENTNKCRTSGNVGFLWLEKNANKYGLFNLKTEAWHWSVNGK